MSLRTNEVLPPFPMSGGNLGGSGGEYREWLRWIPQTTPQVLVEELFPGLGLENREMTLL